MRNKKTVKFLVLCLTFSLMTSCGVQTEPEQTMLVSAMGFDAVETGIRVTLEIPVVEEGKSAETKAVVLSESGENIPKALQTIRAGLSRELIFSHCALAVLGETLSKEQLQAVFDFAGRGETLPLAAEVVSSENSQKLLEAGSFSAPSVGYELPEILERERKQTGVDIRCSVYELRAVASPELPIALPHFSVLGEDSTPAIRWDGLVILRPHGQAFRLTAEESVPYAIFNDEWKANEGNDWIGAARLQKIYSELTVVEQENVLFFSLKLCGELVGGTADDAAMLTERLTAQTEALFARVQRELGEDVLGLGERLRREVSDVWNGVEPRYDALFGTSVFRMECEIEVKG